MAIVSALSAVTDVEPTAIEPITNTIDTDALDALVRGFDPANGPIEVSWTQDGYDVTVSSEGVVTVSLSGDEFPPEPPIDE